MCRGQRCHKKLVFFSLLFVVVVCFLTGIDPYCENCLFLFFLFLLLLLLLLLLRGMEPNCEEFCHVVIRSVYSYLVASFRTREEGTCSD